MQVSMHPQSSTATIGLQHPHAKVSTAFAFPLVANFFAVPLFVLFFLMLAIFQPSFTHFLRLTVLLNFLDVIFWDLVQGVRAEGKYKTLEELS